MHVYVCMYTRITPCSKSASPFIANFAIRFIWLFISGTVGATRASIIICLTRFATPYNVYLDKTSEKSAHKNAQTSKVSPPLNLRLKTTIQMTFKKINQCIHHHLPYLICQKFSRFSPLLNVPLKSTIELTFENFDQCIRRHLPHLIGVQRSAKNSQKSDHYYICNRE